MYIRRDELGERLLRNLQSEVFQPEAVELAVSQFGRQLSSSLETMSGELAQMRQRKEKLETEIQKFMAAIAESGHSKYILEQVATREKEIAAITDRLLAASPNSMEARLREVRSFVTQGIYNLRELLNEGAPLAKSELRRHLHEVRMTPSIDGNGWNYTAEGEWDLIGTDAELASRRQLFDWRPDMVAGACNVPNLLVIAFRFNLLRTAA